MSSCGSGAGTTRWRCARARARWSSRRSGTAKPRTRSPLSRPHRTLSPAAALSTMSSGAPSAWACLEDLRASALARPQGMSQYAEAGQWCGARSNAGFLFFGTMLRSLAASAPAGSATRRAVFSDTAESGSAPAGGSAAGAGELLHDARRGGPLSVLAPVTGLILDSAPSRLTPDIAARRVHGPAHPRSASPAAHALSAPVQASARRQGHSATCVRVHCSGTGQAHTCHAGCLQLL